MERENVYSAIQPTSIPSLGNFLGALKNWVQMQNDYNCIFSIANLHSLTVRQNPSELKKHSRQLFLLLLAMGFDPDKSIIYFQSHVNEHCYLAWILNCCTYTGELSRMTQFKDKSQKHSDNINAGLFTYPALMAADILLYDTDFVPTGQDQKQHVELCRDIAQRFNKLYGETFKIPQPLIKSIGAKIMNLQDPTKKMSKSEENGTIFLLDEPNVIMNKIKKSVTDSDNRIICTKDKPGITNLLEIYCCCKNISISEAENLFADKNYGQFKISVAEAVIELLEPIQKKYKELEQNKDYVDALIKSGMEKASRIAYKKLEKVKRKVGLIGC